MNSHRHCYSFASDLFSRFVLFFFSFKDVLFSVVDVVIHLSLLLMCKKAFFFVPLCCLAVCASFKAL